MGAITISSNKQEGRGEVDWLRGERPGNEGREKE